MFMSLPLTHAPFPYVGYVGERSPILLFTLESLGLHRADFSRRFAESFYHLDWDQYDVRKRQLDLLENFGVPVKQNWSLAKRFYLGEEELLSKLSHSFVNLSTVQCQKLQEVTPFRRRAVGACRLLHDNKMGWQVQTVDNTSFQQPGPENEYLSCPRVFSPIAAWIMQDEMFQKMLCGIAGMLESVTVPLKSFKMIIHQVMSVASEGATGDNAPEGVHQDGADYIVSALLVERKNVSGGVSCICDESLSTKYFVHQLEMGEGLFQCDTGSSLWHDVSKIRFDAKDCPQDEPLNTLGFRSTFGVDIHIEK